MLHSTVTRRRHWLGCALVLSSCAFACASDKGSDTQTNLGGAASSNTNGTTGGDGVSGASSTTTNASSDPGGIGNAQGGGVTTGSNSAPSGGGSPSLGGSSASGGATMAQTSLNGSGGGASAAGGKPSSTETSAVTKGGVGASGGPARGGAGTLGGSSAKPGGTSGIAGRASGGTASSSIAASGGSTASTTAVPSPGCGKTTAPPTNGHHTISVSGASRDYVIKLPDGYDANHPYRLIFGWHGAKYDADWVANGEAPLTGPYFGLESEANGSAIFVAPQASSGGWSNSDLAFADALLTEFESQLCIDKSRIFSVGFSMGAIMTINLGCNRPDVFRAIAPMSGRLPSPCPTGAHIAYWASHGTDDPTIPIADGQAARDEFAKRNHCGTQTVALARSGCVSFQGCDQGYPVNWCTFSGVHEPAPFAGPAIWEFLSPL